MKRERKHKLVMVELWTNPRKMVQGFTTYSPYLAVTPIAESKLYHITHVPTGAKLDSGLKFREAFKVAAALSGIMDWNGNESELKERFFALPQVWQRWARSF